jgi:hypothetical protein
VAQAAFGGGRIPPAKLLACAISFSPSDWISKDPLLVKLASEINLSIFRITADTVKSNHFFL